MANKIFLEWTGGALRYIDQSRIPREELYVETSDYRRVAESIRTLEIRGAPAIGVAAAYAVVLSMLNADSSSDESRNTAFREAIVHLETTRPTAVNLFASLSRMKSAFQGATTKSHSELVEALLAEAQAIEREDRDACEAIARHGLTLFHRTQNVLTHCHTGSLATAGGGTALGIIIGAAKQVKVGRIFVNETRPLLQGARLTTWELMQNGIEATLITDSTAGFVMKQGLVDAVYVGADRIAANGDAANKIGTYGLAVLARSHGIPFYVAAPLSTFDLKIGSGDQIPVEIRPSTDITQIGEFTVAPDGVGVYSPAFDVTPGNLITAMITENGILRPPYRESIPNTKTSEKVWTGETA